MLRLKVCLFVFLDVYVHSENTHSFSHNKGESARVKRPAIVVMVLLVLVFLVTGIASVAGDKDDDADDVAQT